MRSLPAPMMVLVRLKIDAVTLAPCALPESSAGASRPVWFASAASVSTLHGHLPLNWAQMEVFRAG